MMKSILLCSALVAFVFSGCSQPKPVTEKQLGGGCEDCELMFAGMPDNLSWTTTIASPDEPGGQMIIRGTIFMKDGKTPTPGVVLYVYHTDAKGNYSPAAKQVQARRHGHLRGWVKTNEQGQYEFRTIRPASYPNRKDPQHIHPIIYEPGKGYYWVDEYRFEDDPLLTAEEKSRAWNRGGSGVIRLTKNEKGVWTGTRDIILGLNVPGY